MRVETLADAAVRRTVTGRLGIVTGGRQTINITAPVESWLREIGAGSGLVVAFVRHTTASLIIQENADPDVQADLLDALDALAPSRAGYRHHDEGADDMPGHIKATLCPASIAIPCNGRLLLGTWQSLYLVEHRSQGGPREVILTYCGG